jgi:glycosyltransferase involved in cell wall biosynthesis
VEAAAGNNAAPPGDYYLAVGRFVDYKRFDLAVQACTALGRKLRVIGNGPQYNTLKRMAGPTIEFLGRVSDIELRENLAGCRALLFPGEEDFGIVPVEAQSFGRPVIAYASGGALETVRASLPGNASVDNSTGVFFAEQSLSSLKEAILAFESKEEDFSPQAIREHSLQFDAAIFKQKITEFVCFALEDFKHRDLNEASASARGCIQVG